MRTLSKKRVRLAIAVVAVFLGLAAWIIQQRKLSVTILNPKFHLLSATLSHGKTHELAKASWPVTQLSKLLRFVDPRIVVSIRLPPTPKDSYAVAIRYTGDYDSDPVGAVRAELVDASGVVTRPRCWAAYQSGGSRFGWVRGSLWVLDSPLTHPATLRLKTANSNEPLAEIRIQGW